MTLSEYIKRLQALEENNGHLPVVMTQSGYYADDQFADLYDFPEVKPLGDYYEETIGGDWSKRKRINYTKEYVILGHSHQSY